MITMELKKDDYPQELTIFEDPHEKPWKHPMGEKYKFFEFFYSQQYLDDAADLAFNIQEAISNWQFQIQETGAPENVMAHVVTIKKKAELLARHIFSESQALKKPSASQTLKKPSDDQ